MKKATQAVRAGTRHDKNMGGLNTPMLSSSAIEYLDDSEVRYPRYFNLLNHDVVAEKMSVLEGAEAGELEVAHLAIRDDVLVAEVVDDLVPRLREDDPLLNAHVEEAGSGSLEGVAESPAGGFSRRGGTEEGGGLGGVFRVHEHVRRASDAQVFVVSDDLGAEGVGELSEVLPDVVEVCREG